jgi:hypothetical protein
MSFAANAADMPVKAPIVKAPAMYNWNGCQVGAHAGAGWARTSFTNTADTVAFGDLVPGQGFPQANSGFIAAVRSAASIR